MQNHDRVFRLLPAFTLAGLLQPLPMTAAHAEITANDVNQKLEDQDQRIRVLEHKLESSNEAAASSKKSSAIVKADSSGFSIQSADGQNIIKLRGTLNVDGRYFVDGITPTTADTFLLRKVRPIVEGTLDGIYDFRLQPDFGSGKSVILDAYVAARFKSWFVVSAGKFKTPVGLERLQSDAYNRFVELGFPSSLVPNRDIGIQFSGKTLRGAINYAIAYTNGVIDGSSSDSNPTPDTDTDGKHETSARVFVLPFVNSNRLYLRGFGIGIAGSLGSKAGSAALSNAGTVNGTTAAVVTANTSSWLPSYRTPGQRSFFSYRGDTASTTNVNEAVFADGTHTRLSPQAYYYYGSFGVLTEYVASKQAVTRHLTSTTDNAATLKNSAWQVTASFFLTGEEAEYNSVTPLSNFAVGKPGSGAWELAVRYQRLDVDSAAFTGGASSFADPTKSPSVAKGYSAALNWYLNKNVRWTLEYDQTKFTGGAGTSTSVVDRKDEKGILLRFALNY
ncbi:MAG TPA: porin [Steroidobacteraceae bacterium]|nr:porin [Steroidobacteraceae bacterium]